MQVSLLSFCRNLYRTRGVAKSALSARVRPNRLKESFQDESKGLGRNRALKGVWRRMLDRDSSLDRWRGFAALSLNLALSSVDFQLLLYLRAKVRFARRQTRRKSHRTPSIHLMSFMASVDTQKEEPSTGRLMSADHRSAQVIGFNARTTRTQLGHRQQSRPLGRLRFSRQLLL